MPGNFGWLTWDGQNNAPAMATMLTPPGNSHPTPTRMTPAITPCHRRLVQGWASLTPAASAAHWTLKTDIVVPVWGWTATAQARLAREPALYHVVSSLVRIAIPLPSETAFRRI